MRRAFFLLAVAALVTMGIASGAAADPKGDTFELVCDNGQTYELSAPPPDARWTPGLDVDSNLVFTPVAFGETHFELFDSQGNLLFEETEPPEAKKGRMSGRQLMDCSYTAMFEFVDPDLGDVVARVSGDVTAAVTRG